MRIVLLIIGLFVALPLVELYLLLKLGQATSPEVAISVVIVTGVVGGVLARSQGLRALRRLRDDIQHGRLPAEALFDGALVLVGGVLLLTPGLITDSVGLVLLIPFTRTALKKILRKKIIARIKVAGPNRGYTDVHFTAKHKR
jgi:UPF0716 protein FxsA